MKQCYGNAGSASQTVSSINLILCPCLQDIFRVSIRDFALTLSIRHTSYSTHRDAVLTSHGLIWISAPVVPSCPRAPVANRVTVTLPIIAAWHDIVRKHDISAQRCWDAGPLLMQRWAIMAYYRIGHGFEGAVTAWGATVDTQCHLLPAK